MLLSPCFLKESKRKLAKEKNFSFMLWVLIWLVARSGAIVACRFLRILGKKKG